MIRKLRRKVRQDLESPPELRRFGSGWLSGVGALVLSLSGLLLVLSLRFPNVFAVPPLRGAYDQTWFRLTLHFVLIAAFVLSAITLFLRQTKTLGLVSITVVLLATLLGGSRAASERGELVGGAFLGVDWFVLNVIFTGFLFVPLEKLFPRHPGQPLFRTEWREDLFYFLVSSMLVQLLTFLSMAPANAILHHTAWTSFRASVAAQPVLLQILEIMFLTDLVQYWVHRAFHRVPFLWHFHAVHHSAQTMDWMAGARMHFMEIIVLRGTTVIPMTILGYAPGALHAYILLVYLHSTFIHANVGWRFRWLDKWFVTPRFHHWHHGIEAEAIDVNFAIHFPLLDRIFGTHHLPRDQWPSGYGVGGHPVPTSYLAQFLYPFRPKKP